MSSYVPFPSTLGFAFSIGSLALSPFVSYFMRMFSQSLTIVQLVYLFGNIYAQGTSLFANNLDQSWLGFIPSILTYCPSGSTYECSNANLITIALVWLALMVLIKLVVKIVSIKKPNASFKPFYNFFRGVLRWSIIPLVYNSFVVFIQSLRDEHYHRDYYACITLLLFYGVTLLIELIAFKCTEQQDENSWNKWIQFFGPARIDIIVLLVALSSVLSPTTKYTLYAPIILYDIFHLVKFNYSFKIVERIIFILQESLFITIYSMFIFDQGHIKQYGLDFIAVAATILLQLLQLLLRIYSYCKLNGSENALIRNEDVQTPQKNKRTTLSKQKSTTKLSSLAKQNSFANLDDTIAELKNSSSSPRRRGGRLV